MIYPIVVFGSPVLREKCREIGPDYPEVKKLIEDMFLTLEEAEGVGLAAPQIGKSIRLFIVDCTPWGEDHPDWPITGVRSSIPKFTKFPRRRNSTKRDAFRCRDCTRACGRSLAIRMRYLDENFEPHDEEFTGLLPG